MEYSFCKKLPDGTWQPIPRGVFRDEDASYETHQAVGFSANQTYTETTLVRTWPHPPAYLKKLADYKRVQEQATTCPNHWINPISMVCPDCGKSGLFQ